MLFVTIRRFMVGITLLGLASTPTLANDQQQSATNGPAEPGIVRACVIGGMTMTGLWDEIVQRFEAEHPYKVRLVATGARPKISPAFRRGEADFLVMHSGDITTDLMADGYGINMRACARNDLVLLGPLPTRPAFEVSRTVPKHSSASPKPKVPFSM